MAEHAAGDGLYPAFAQLSAPWRACLEQAWESFCHGSLPIGAAVIGANDQVVALGRNRLSEPHAQAPHLPGAPYLTGSVLVALQLVRFGLEGAATPFSEAWRGAFPVACEVSENLRASEVIHHLAQQAASVEEAWSALVGELAAARSAP